jgi:hypothetical protein
MTSSRWRPASHLLKNKKQTIILLFINHISQMRYQKHTYKCRKHFEANNKKCVDFVSKKICFHHTAHAHLQLQTFRSDIIWIISNAIILLSFSFNLITTSFRYRINYLINPNLNMVRVCRHILKWLRYILVKYINY